MKLIFALSAVGLAVGLAAIWQAVRTPDQFGKFTGAPKVEVADLIARPKDFRGKAVTVEGKVTEQCKSMGCFFAIPVGTKSLRVDLQEIAMHAPHREGRTALVEGQLTPYRDG